MEKSLKKVKLIGIIVAVIIVALTVGLTVFFVFDKDKDKESDGSYSLNKDLWIEYASGGLEGDGTNGNPYLVQSAEDLAYISLASLNGEDFDGEYFMQTTNINLQRHEWVPIGYASSINTVRFNGYYDGGGFYISNLTHNYVNTANLLYDAGFDLLTSYDYSNSSDEMLCHGGLFACAQEINNLSLINAEVICSSSYNANWDYTYSYAYLGGLVGMVYGDSHLTGLHFDGTIYNDFGGYDEGGNLINSVGYIGAIAGYVNSGSAERCSSSGEIIIEYPYEDCCYVGGLFGYLSDQLLESKSSIKISNVISGINGHAPLIGGLVGDAEYNIEDCYFEGSFDIFAQADWSVSGCIGGIAAESSGYIGNCYNFGYFNDYSYYSTGGYPFAGIAYRSGSVENCFVIAENQNFIGYAEEMNDNYHDIQGDNYHSNCFYANAQDIYQDSAVLSISSAFVYAPEHTGTLLPVLYWEVEGYEKIDFGNSITQPDGSGSEADPYIIATAENLLWLSYSTFEQSESYRDCYFVQTADIDLSGYEWVPIGLTGDYSVTFEGYYDGRGYDIYNLSTTFTNELQTLFFYDDDKYVCGGLFKTAKYLKNINLVNAEVLDNSYNTIQYLGGIVGALNTDGGGCYITNCSFNGNIICGDGESNPSSSSLGGIVGLAYGQNNDQGRMTGCSSSGKILHFYPGLVKIGGIIAENAYGGFYQIAGCSSEMIIQGVEGYESYYGGIVGLNTIEATLIKQCYFTGIIDSCVYNNSYCDVQTYASGIANLSTEIIYVTIAECYTLTKLRASINCGIACATDYAYIARCYAFGYLEYESDAIYFISDNNNMGECGYQIYTYNILEANNCSGLTAWCNGLSDLISEDTPNWDENYYCYSVMPKLKEDYLYLLNNFTLEGDGENYYVYTAEELLQISEAVADGITTFENVTFHQMADIDLSRTVWLPIGLGSDLPFKGSYYGGGHTISGLGRGGFTYDDVVPDYIGLFGYAEGGNLCDIHIIDSYLPGSGNHQGFIAGLSTGLIDYCTVKDSDIYPSGDTGGIVGNTSANVEYCEVDGLHISGYSNHVGGVAGVSGASIKKCYVKNSFIDSSINVGGIVGWLLGGEIVDCYNYADVYGGDAVGGIVGVNQNGTVTNCYNYGGVQLLGSAKRIGGIVGDSYGTCKITACYNIANVGNFSSSATEGGIGGIVGEARYGKTTITNSHSDGIVVSSSNTAQAIGGIIGSNLSGSSIIEKCTVKGTLYAQKSGSIIGGFIGKDTSGITVTDSAINAKIITFGYSATAGAFIGQCVTISSFTNCSFIGSLMGASNRVFYATYGTSSPPVNIKACYVVDGVNKYYTAGDWSAWTPTNNLNNGYPMQNALYSTAIGGYTSAQVEANLKGKGFILRS